MMKNKVKSYQLEPSPVTSLGAPASSRHSEVWHSRGYVPHFDHPGLIQAITFRLADSLPFPFFEQCEKELTSLREEQRQSEKEKRIAACLDGGHGACHLKDPRIAQLVEDALLYFDGKRYRLLAWCVMPNHVHVLIEIGSGFPLSRVVHSWKSFTANKANRILGRSGEFWMREYHDRFIRDEPHLNNARNYIEENPVKAGLVDLRLDWRWSSAWRGREEEDAGKDAGGPSEESVAG